MKAGKTSAHTCFENLSEKARKITFNTPSRPGVYLMKNAEGKIIYIGKAKNLKNRVLTYFTPNRMGPKTWNLARQTRSVETILTDNETEAYILEGNLIKKYKPRFNIELKETNRYPYIKITSEPFPRIIKTRVRVDDGALYFGPYPSSKYINRTIKTLTDIFPIRRCKKNLEKKTPETPCLNYNLGKCVGPCTGKISKEKYRGLTDQVVLFLKGQNNALLNRLENQMHEAAQQQRYEQAIRLRERYKAVKNLLSDQKITTSPGQNQDIVGMACSEDRCAFTVLIKREGKIIGKRDYITESGISQEETLEQFLDRYYENTTSIPHHILLPLELEESTPLKNYIKTKYERSVTISVPKRGMKKRLVNLACKNAYQKIQEELYRYNPQKALETLKQALRLKKVPENIEAFDVATLLGSFSVASMIKFNLGTPDKKNYRRFKIKYSAEQNDVEMIKEAIARRYQRLLNEKKPLPDLVLVDGGLPQVNGAQKVLKSLNLEQVPLAGLAKKYEDIYTPGQKSPLKLHKSSDTVRLLMAVRNEAHRFANAYHIKLRNKTTLQSRLKEIPGIGDVLAPNILSTLNSSSGPPTVDTLSRIKGIGKKKARQVLSVIQDMYQ